MKLFLALVFTASLISGACGKKPAYSDIKVDDQGRAATEASNQQRAASNQPPADNPQASPTDSGSQGEQPPAAPAPPQPQAVKMPSFFDAAKGEIKDLPSYPKGARISMQVGPMRGVDAVLIVLQTNDPVSKVAQFYDRATRGKGWAIVERVSDPEIFKLELSKGAAHEGLIRAMKNPQTGMTQIALSRIEKPPDMNPAEDK